jgi:hypothetical protein
METGVAKFENGAKVSKNHFCDVYNPVISKIPPTNRISDPDLFLTGPETYDFF